MSQKISEEDAAILAELQRQAQSGGISTTLKEQIEISLDGAYKFNADTAKFGIVWVWFTSIPKWGCFLGIWVSLAGFLLKLTDQFERGEWTQWLLAVLASFVGWCFFWYVNKGMRVSYETGMRMAEAYQKREGSTDQLESSRSDPVE